MGNYVSYFIGEGGQSIDDSVSNDPVVNTYSKVIKAFFDKYGDDPFYRAFCEGNGDVIFKEIWWWGTRHAKTDGDIIYIDLSWASNHIDAAVDKLHQRLIELANDDFSATNTTLRGIRYQTETAFLDALAAKGIPLDVWTRPNRLGEAEIRDWNNAVATVLTVSPGIGTWISVGELSTGRNFSFLVSEQRDLTTTENVLTVLGIYGPVVLTTVNAGGKQLVRSSRQFDNLADAARHVDNLASKSALVVQIQSKLDLYPKVIDARTGRHIGFPSGITGKVDKSLQVPWAKHHRAGFIAEWKARGYAEPVGGWDKYDIHHIQPREFGGTNDFWDLVPVERETHQDLFNEFRREFLEL